ncbi:MAG: hypothetical protein ABIL40_10995, partial [candidate division WOR-3 bacterium]
GIIGMDWDWWMGDMSERIMRRIRETFTVNRETSSKGEQGRIRMNRGKEGEQNKPEKLKRPDKPERRDKRDRPDGMVQYRPFGTCKNCSIASLAGTKGHFCQRLKANG